jgi:UDPglucose 6-dehydrogenase
MKREKIVVVGSGYVGMSFSVLLAQRNDVTVLDIDTERVAFIYDKKSTVADAEIEHYLAEQSLCLSATLDKQVAYRDASYIVVATPTNYDPQTNYFDTNSVDSVIGDALQLNKEALVVIKSTVPVGHTKLLQKKFVTNRVIFSPKFLEACLKIQKI